MPDEERDEEESVTVVFWPRPERIARDGESDVE